MTRILLVGGGMTGAVTASLIKQELPSAQIVLWDKARGVGGRMSTSRSNVVKGASVDLGVQYITATPQYFNTHNKFYNDLINKDLLRPLATTIEGMVVKSQEDKNFVAPLGSSSLVKHFAEQSGCEIKTNHHLTAVNSDSDGWKVSGKDVNDEKYDVVVLTIPVPQILGLSGRVKQLIEKDEEILSNLKKVDYSSRYALGLYYDSEGVTLPNNCAAQYISGHDFIRFVSIDNVKRGQGSVATSVVVHTSVPFGKENVEKTPEEVKPILLEGIKKMFPDWPTPSEVKCQKWRYSQVSSPYPGSPGSLVLDEGLVIGGDGFTHSNMDGCIESAKSIVNNLIGT